MIYDHIVKHNGKYYEAGEEVPESKEPRNSEDMNDKDVLFETDISGNSGGARRGRPKKSN